MSDFPPYPGTPRWVKVFGLIALGIVVLVVIVMLISGGDHGPRRHISAGGLGGHTGPSSVPEYGVQQP